MKLLKAVVHSSIGFCLVLSLSSSFVSSKGQPSDSLQWGVTVNGLQMSLSAVDSRKTTVTEFQIALRNVGDQDVTLNLGMMLANGKVQLPQSISFALIDASGKTRKFKFSDPKYGFVAGRADDYLVPLRSGSIYTLKLSSHQLWSLDTKDYGLKLPAGKCQITAQFEGSGAMMVNLDMPGVKLMNFWHGRLQSNTLVIDG